MTQRQVGAGMLAGLAGGATFAAVMKIDIAVSGEPIDDFMLLGGFGPLQDYWRVTGPCIHAVNSVALGALYAVVVDRLPGPGWVSGLTFALLENTMLWPVVIALDRVHPAIRSGKLPTFHRPWPVIAENLRHAAYGITLGVVHERLTLKQRAVRMDGR